MKMGGKIGGGVVDLLGRRGGREELEGGWGIGMEVLEEDGWVGEVDGCGMGVVERVGVWCRGDEG